MTTGTQCGTQWTNVDAGQWEVEPIYTFSLPRVFEYRRHAWVPYFERVDTTASHPDTWDVLAELARAPTVQTIVEAGTYRGHALFAMAESLRLRGTPEGHIWSADVEDFGVVAELDKLGLADRVSWCHGTFADMLPHVPAEIDLAFIDASQTGHPLLRLEYLDLVLSRLSKHGLVVCDDSTDDAWEGAAMLRARANLYLPRGHGLTIFQNRA